MKKYFLIILLFSSLSFAKNVDSLSYRWQPSLKTGLSISQIAFSHWAKGGGNSFTWTLTGDFHLNYKTPEWLFSNELKSAYGRTKLGNGTYRTNNNELFLEDIFSYDVGWEVNPFVSNSIRTQVASGFNYKKKPVKKVSDFFDPGYITQSFGFTYNTHKTFETRLGIAFQQTFTNIFNQYTDNPDTKDKVEKFKFETGFESVSSTEFFIDTNLKLKSRLRLFTRFEHINVWDVRWENSITAKINSWLDVNFAFLLVYKKSQSPYTQIKEGLQVGVFYNII